MTNRTTRKSQVIVVGAGAAGIAAAISAARNGADTLLIEYQGFLGGISATLPWLGFHDRDYRQVVKGLPAEIVSRLQQADGASSYEYDPKCGSFVSVDSHLWKCLAMELVQEAGVKVLFHSQVVETMRDGNRILGVVVENKSGRQELFADITIDCSGDGDVAARAGVRWEKGRTSDGLVQSPTLVFRIGGIDADQFVNACKSRNFNYREWIFNFPDLWEKMMNHLTPETPFILGGFANLIEQARKNGDFDVPQTRIVGVKLHRKDQVSIVMTRVLGLDPTDIDSLTSAYAKTYQQIPELLAFWRNYVPGGKNAYLIEIAPMLGIRESRRIIGDYVLTADLVSGRSFSDGVAMGGYHIDIHRPSGSWVESKNVQAYTIPLRSLIASKVEGLMMAGKCLSATHEAVASTRVIPICMAQGQAAGTAAAMAVGGNVDIRNIDTAALRSVLETQGVEIGRTLGDPNVEIIERIGQLPFDEPPTTGDLDAATTDSKHWVR